MPTMPAAPAVKPRKTKLEDALAARRAAMRTKFDALEVKARENHFFEAGGRVYGRWEFLANALGVSSHTIAHWVRRGYAPRAMCFAVERTYGRSLVRAEDLAQVLIPE